jgi:hypothetical protein
MELARVAYEYTPGDAVAAAVYLTDTNPVGRAYRRRYAGGFTAVGVLFGLFAAAWLWLNPRGGEVLGYSLAAVAVYLVFSGLRFQGKIRSKVTDQLARYYDRDECQTLFGPITVVVRRDRLELAGRYSRSEHQWATVTRAAVDDEYLFLVLHGATAVPVPRNAFPSDEAFDRFVEAVRTARPEPVE